MPDQAREPNRLDALLIDTDEKLLALLGGATYMATISLMTDLERLYSDLPAQQRTDATATFISLLSLRIARGLRDG